MTWDELLEYCLAKPGAWQDEPWEGDVVVKVGQKIFAFLGTGAGTRPGVGLKCGATREAADEWVLRYPGDATVMPYIGRSGWNNLRTGSNIPDDEVFEAIDASYAMVVSKLPKKDRPADPRLQGGSLGGSWSSQRSTIFAAVLILRSRPARRGPRRPGTATRRRRSPAGARPMTCPG
jgi:predicted DNA-binding protein (MmcQ/YjbR family)